MPCYQYRNNATGEEFHEYESWDASQQRLAENPDLQRVLGAPGIVSGRGSGPKVDSGFKEVMSKMQEAHKVRGPQIDKWTK
jgi:predicted nucleic acid-binding Zn ribbon protein